MKRGRPVKAQQDRPTGPTFKERRDSARLTYCHRYSVSGIWLEKTCPRYQETCGRTCYKEDDQLRPICFVEPPQRPLTQRPKGIDYSTIRVVNIGYRRARTNLIEGF